MNWQWRGRPSVAAALVMVVGAVGLANVVPAHAQDDEQSDSGKPERVEKLAPTMLVLDASGSMREQDPSGGTRMDAAKKALNTVVDEAPDGAEMGLMAYGNTAGKVANDLQLGCKDINTLQEVGPVDRKGMKSTVAGIEPHGYTPVGKSLKAAAEQLPAEGPRAVILISDGEETCAPPPPCEIAENLREQGVDLTMHTVGFQVGKKARKELECIADAGGGSYVDAPDAATLEEELPKITERALRNYQLAGEPITGTEEVTAAPDIGPGQYVDTIDAGQTKYYKIDVPKQFTAHVSATPVLPRDEELESLNRLETVVGFVDSRGVPCIQNDESFSDWAPMAPNALGWTPHPDAECDTEQLYVAVERHGPSETNNWTYDMELQVILEPPVSGSSGPAANSAPMPFEKPSGTVRPVVGGGGFNDATELAPESATYSDTLRYGEMATYKVPLKWGQALAVQAHLGEGHTEDEDPFGRVTYSADIYAPNRSKSQDWNAYDTSNETDPRSLDPIGTTRVLYLNRGEDMEYDSESAAMAGWHYITVQLDADAETAEVEIELDVNVQGDPIDPPEYASIGDYPAAPVTEKPEPEPAQQDGKTGKTGKDGNDKSQEESEETEQTAATGDDDGSGPVPWVLAAGGGVVLIGMTAILLVVRNRRPDTGSGGLFGRNSGRGPGDGPGSGPGSGSSGSGNGGGRSGPASTNRWAAGPATGVPPAPGNSGGPLPPSGPPSGPPGGSGGPAGTPRGGNGPPSGPPRAPGTPSGRPPSGPPSPGH